MNEWEEIDSKSVSDADGFLTDYTMYRNAIDGTYIFIFGDKDAYTPENSDPDWECDSENEAYEWFDDYTGIDDMEEGTAAYKITGYYSNNYNGVGEEFTSSDWSEIAETAHQYLSDGYYVEIMNTLTGVTVRLDPDTYDFDGEFPLRPKDLWGVEASESICSSSGLDPEKEKFYRAYPSKPSEEYMDMGSGLFYWYFTRHGVQPGSVPRGLNIIDVVDTPQGSFFLTDRVLTTDSLKYYDIKEASPEGR